MGIFPFMRLYFGVIYQMVAMKAREEESGSIGFLILIFKTISQF